MGGKKDNQLKNWLLKNKKYILENMTTTWSMGKEGQGGMPIAIQKHLQILPQIFRIDLPEDLINAVDKCKSNAEIRQVGIEWAIQQSIELKAAGVPVLHYYSMGKSENIRQIASKVF